MKNMFVAICLLAAASSCASADTLYRWVDKDGKVHYGDTPAGDAAKTEKRKFAAPVSAGDDDLSYSVRKAKQDFPVTLYVAPGCGDPCNQARAFLNKRGIPFVEKSLATNIELDAFRAKTGGNSIPALTVGKSLLSGFEAGQWNEELDIAGYPKIAPYGSRPLLQPAAAKPEPPAASGQ